jgi:hypothetical protein
LAETSFAIDDATAEEIEANPKVALPKLAANIYLMAVENSFAAFNERMATMLPQTVAAVIESRKMADENTNKFFGAFPALKDHVDKIGPMAVTFRQLQPTLSAEEFIQKFGEYAHLALNIPKPAAVASAAPATQPIAPHAPIVAAVPRAAPVTPGTPVNPFAALAGTRGEVSGFDEDPDDD